MDFRWGFGVDLFISVEFILDLTVLGVRLLFSFLGNGGATYLAGEDAILLKTDDLKEENTGLFLLADFETSFW